MAFTFDQRTETMIVNAGARPSICFGRPIAEGTEKLRVLLQLIVDCGLSVYNIWTDQFGGYMVHAKDGMLSFKQRDTEDNSWTVMYGFGRGTYNLDNASHRAALFCALRSVPIVFE